MLLEMKKTQQGSLDGIKVKEFKKGEIYEFKEGIKGHMDLANVFLVNDWAEEVKAEKIDSKRQAIGPDDKMFSNPDRNMMTGPEQTTGEKPSMTGKIKSVLKRSERKKGK